MAEIIAKNVVSVSTIRPANDPNGLFEAVLLLPGTRKSSNLKISHPLFIKDQRQQLIHLSRLPGLPVTHFFI